MTSGMPPALCQPFITFSRIQYWCWRWSSNMLATWCQEWAQWKRPWCWERLKAKREAGGRGWNGLIASLTQWTWIWANSGRWWRTEEPSMLQSMGLQRAGHNLATERQVHFNPHFKYVYGICVCLTTQGRWEQACLLLFTLHYDRPLVIPKGNQSWIFIGRTDAEAPTLWPPDPKHWLRKDPDAGKDEGRQEEKGMTEDEMVGWHHQLDGHESEQAPGVGDGQGGLVCCRSWGRGESDTTERLNWTN